MNHVISFRRPGQIRALTKLTVPPDEDAATYVRRLENLGYTVVEVAQPDDHHASQLELHVGPSLETDTPHKNST